MRSSDASPSEIARNLNIDYLVEGSVVLVGDSVRITAQLIDMATEEHVWSDSFRGLLSAVLSMQSRAATAIADTIKVTLTPADERRLSVVPEVNPEAYRLHLQARSFFNEGVYGEALDLIQSSIALESDYAPAHALNAIVHVMLAGFSGRSSSAPLARSAVRRALELDPELPLAHVAAGMIHFDLDWDWKSAEEAYQRALALVPNYSGAHEAYGHLLYCLGRNQEAEREGLLAKASDPLSVSVNDFLADLAYSRGRYDETISYSQSALELDPDDPHAVFYTGLAFAAINETELARGAFLQSLNYESQWTLLAYQHLGLWDQIPAPAIEAVSETTPFALAIVYAERGENESAIEMIRRSMTVAPAWLVYLKPQFESYTSLWEDPRFQEIVREVGLHSFGR